MFSSIDTVLANQSFGSESTEIYLKTKGFIRFTASGLISKDSDSVK